MVGRWLRQPEYSHGFFLPGMTAWLVWRDRHILRASIGGASPWGVVCVALSICTMLLGQIAALYFLLQFGLWLAWVGLILCYGGVSLFRAARFPLLLLLLAIPLPYFVDAQISWRLQLLSSQLGVSILRGAGYSVFLEGNVIDLGLYKLQVIDACSGLRYLYPLAGIGFILAYMYPAAWYWRVLVFVSTLPVTVVMNSLRIAVVGALVNAGGADMADGAMHYFEGWVVFLLSLGALLLEMACIERGTQHRPLRELLRLPRATVVPGVRSPRNGWCWLLPMSMLVLSVAGYAGYRLDRRVELHPERQSLRTFPLMLNGWRAQESSLPLDMEQALGFDDYVLADYWIEGDAPVNLYISYYQSQRKGLSPHSPQVCIPGGGWTVSSVGHVALPQPQNSGLTVARVLIQRGQKRMLVYYWFEQRGRHLSNEYSMKWYLLRDAWFRNRTDGALVRLATPIDAHEPVESADQRLGRWVNAVMPVLPAYVPI